MTANRFKTTIRYGRREAVNPATCIEIFLPDSYNGELLLSSQYGNIMTDADWKVERFAAETTEGSISLNTITAPRIRLVSSTSRFISQKQRVLQISILFPVQLLLMILKAVLN